MWCPWSLGPKPTVFLYGIEKTIPQLTSSVSSLHSVTWKVCDSELSSWVSLWAKVDDIKSERNKIFDNFPIFSQGKVDWVINLAKSTRLFDIMPGGSEAKKSCLIINHWLDKLKFIIKSMEEVDSKPTSRFTVIVRGANASILVGLLSFAITWKVNSASFNPLALIIKKMHIVGRTRLKFRTGPDKFFFHSIQKEIF